MTSQQINEALQILKSQKKPIEIQNNPLKNVKEINRQKLKISLKILGLEDIMPSDQHGKFILALVKTLENQQKPFIFAD